MLRSSRQVVRMGMLMANRSMATAAPAMEFTFASPGEVFYNKADVRQVDVPSLSGSFGILPSHVPVLASLAPGVVAVHEHDDSVKKFFVSSGTISVNDDSSVQVLAEEVCSIADLDKSAVQQGLSKAQQTASSASDEAAKAEAMIEVEVHEAMIKAIDSA